MPKIPSILGLHLRYRIWIAAMNADITMLRIFDDYIEAFPPGKQDQDTIKAIEEFKSQFVVLRKEIDDLKHEMHLQKMKLAANAREEKAIDKKLYKTDNHAALKKRYSIFRKAFNTMKTAFGLVKDNWVD